MSFNPASAANTVNNFPYSRLPLMQHIDSLSYIPGVNCIIGAVRLSCSLSAIVVSKVASAFAKSQIKRGHADYTPILERWKFIQIHSRLECKHALMEMLYIPLLFVDFNKRIRVDLAMALLLTIKLSTEDKTAFHNISKTNRREPANPLSDAGLSLIISTFARYQVSLPDELNEHLVCQALVFKNQGNKQFDSFIYAFFEHAPASSVLRVLTENPTHLATCCKNDQSNILDLVLERPDLRRNLQERDICRGCFLPVIEQACLLNHPHVLELLVPKMQFLTQQEKDNLFRRAVLDGHAGVVKLLVPMCSFSTDSLDLLLHCLVDPTFAQRKDSLSIVKMIKQEMHQRAANHRERNHWTNLRNRYFSDLITSAKGNPGLENSFGPLIHFFIKDDGILLSSHNPIVLDLYNNQNTQLMRVLFAHSTKEEIIKIICQPVFWTNPNEQRLASLLQALSARDPSLLDTCLWYLSSNQMTQPLQAVIAAGGRITVNILGSQSMNSVTAFKNALPKLPPDFQEKGLTEGGKSILSNLHQISNVTNFHDSLLSTVVDYCSVKNLSPYLALCIPLIRDTDEAVLSNRENREHITKMFCLDRTLLTTFLSRSLTAVSAPLLSAVFDRYIMSTTFDEGMIEQIIQTGLVSDSDCLAKLLTRGHHTELDVEKIRLLITHKIGINTPTHSAPSSSPLRLACIHGFADLCPLLAEAGAQYFPLSPHALATPQENAVLANIALHITERFPNDNGIHILTQLMTPIHNALKTYTLLGLNHPVRHTDVNAMFDVLTDQVYNSPLSAQDCYNFQNRIAQILANCRANYPPYLRHLHVEDNMISVTQDTREQAPELIVLSLEACNRLRVRFLNANGVNGPGIDGSGLSRDLITELRNLFDKKPGRLIAMKDGIPVYRSTGGPFASGLSTDDQDRFYHALGALFELISAHVQGWITPTGLILPDFYFALLCQLHSLVPTLNAKLFDPKVTSPEMIAQRYSCIEAYIYARNDTLLKERCRLASLTHPSAEDKMKFYLLEAYPTLEIDREQLELMNATKLLDHIALPENRETQTQKEIEEKYAARLQRLRETLVDGDTGKVLFPESFVNPLNPKELAVIDPEEVTVKDLLDKLDLKKLPPEACGFVVDLLVTLAKLQSVSPQEEEADQIELRNRLTAWVQKNLPADKLKDVMVTQRWGEDQRAIRPALSIVKGMIDGAQRRAHAHLSDLISPSGLELAKAIQGQSTSPKRMLKLVSFTGVPSHMVTWFKDFIKQNDDETAAALLAAITGQRTLIEGMTINIRLSNQLMAHTCSRSLEVRLRMTRYQFEEDLRLLIANGSVYSAA